MKNQFNLLLQTRKNLLKTMEHFTFQELSKIPKGFNNNIVWNFNHAVLVMHLLTYKLSGLEVQIDKNLISKYSKGAKPNADIPEEDFIFFKSIALSSVKQLEQDYNATLFKNYKEYPTSYNVTLTNIEEAISFNNLHEGLHFGYILAQIKGLDS